MDHKTRTPTILHRHLHPHRAISISNDSRIRRLCSRIIRKHHPTAPRKKKIPIFHVVLQ